MSGSSVPVSVNILDKEYMISCPEDERQSLIDSAKYLDARMREARDSGKVIGTERVAVLTALNIIHELLEHKRERNEFEQTVEDGVQRLREKIEAALGRRVQEEAVE